MAITSLAGRSLARASRVSMVSLAVLVGCLMCAGCGLAVDPAVSRPGLATGSDTTVATPGPVVVSRAGVPPAVAASSVTPPPPYVRTPGRLAELARAFVQAVCAYDARTQDPAAFLSDLRGLVTAAERDRLAHSARARLPWAALRARGERTQVSFLGLSTPSAKAAQGHRRGRTRRVVVAMLVTTRTDFATLRGFQRITLTLQHNRHARHDRPEQHRGMGWRVADAVGAGL